MIRRTAGYLTALLVTAYLFFMYDASALSGILVLFVLYPVLSAVYLVLAGKKAEPGGSGQTDKSGYFCKKYVGPPDAAVRASVFRQK